MEIFLLDHVCLGSVCLFFLSVHFLDLERGCGLISAGISLAQ